MLTGLSALAFVEVIESEGSSRDVRSVGGGWEEDED